MQLAPPEPGRQLVPRSGAAGVANDAVVDSARAAAAGNARAATTAGDGGTSTQSAAVPLAYDISQKDAATPLRSGLRAFDPHFRGVGTANAATGTRAADDARWSSEFTRTFAALAEQAEYPMFTALAPALTGVSRQRVEALLSLP